MTDPGVGELRQNWKHVFALGLGTVCFGGLCLKPSAPVSIHFGNTSVFTLGILQYLPPPTLHYSVFSIHIPLSGVSTLMAQRVEHGIVPLEVSRR